MNQTQKRLVGTLLPMAAVLVLFLLPLRSWDTRPLLFAIFVATFVVMWAEVVLFGLEEKLRKLGKPIVIALPIFAFVLAWLIAASPRIESRPVYIYSPPSTLEETEHKDALGEAVKRAKRGPTFEYLPLKAETAAEQAKRLDAERVGPKERSLRLENPFDRHLVPYWLVLLALIGIIEFRLLANANDA